MIREAEAREQAKRVQRELAKKRAEQSVPDKMKSISSSDYQTQPERTQQPKQVEVEVNERPVQELGGGKDRPKKAMVLGKTQTKMIPEFNT